MRLGRYLKSTASRIESIMMMNALSSKASHPDGYIGTSVDVCPASSHILIHDRL